MDVNKIFSNKKLLKIETELVKIFSEHKKVEDKYDIFEWLRLRRGGLKKVAQLFDDRKSLLDKMFQIDDESKKLLGEFNEALRSELVNMRNRALAAYNAVCGVCDKSSAHIEVEAKCFMGFKYPPIHPIQTAHAKKMWTILTSYVDPPFYFDSDAMEYYNEVVGLYYDGVSGMSFKYDGKLWKEGENEFIYNNIKDEIDNWNDGLDRELTKDMNLIYAFHNLIDHCYFSILDLLWVRDFTTTINVSIDNHEDDFENMYDLLDDKTE